MDDPREQSITIARRFCGPPKTANGGYACGRLAAFVHGPAEVTLRHPPPLEKPMRVITESDGVALYDADMLIGTAKPGRVSLEVPRAPDFDDANAAAGRTIPPEKHNLPTCFVCGPSRARGDGLRIHVGPLDANDSNWSGWLAAPWLPLADLADDDGSVRAEFVWAALDCPSGYAAGFSATDVFLLLGRQTVEIHRRPTAGEHCVVAARERRRDGRKHYADSVLFGAAGDAVAICNATWIAVDAAVMRGDG